MRSWLLWIGCVLVVPTWALANPTVAVAPLEGDSGNKIGNLVAKIAGDDATVIGPKETARAMEKLGLSGELDRKAQKRLRAKLEADVIVQGKLEVADDDDEKTIEILVSGRAVKGGRFKLRFKTATSASFRSDLREALAKRLAPSGDAETEPELDADEPERARKLTDGDSDDGSTSTRNKRDDGDDASATRRKRGDDDDDTMSASKKRRADDDDDAPRTKRRKHREDDDHGSDARSNHAATRAVARVHAGAALARRGLTYESSTGTAPRRVGVVAVSARVEGEVYPGSFWTRGGMATRIGLYGEFDRAVGLSVRVPNTTTTVPINLGHYAIGVRYRAAIGTSSLAFGVGYARRRFIADRSGLVAPVILDTPDVDYAAIAPGVVGRIAVAPKISVVLGASFLLMIGAGQIVTTESFGFADITAFELAGGVDVALAKHYGLHVAAEVTQIGLAFKNAVRGVTGATDRTIGITASFAATY